MHQPQILMMADGAAVGLLHVEYCRLLSKPGFASYLKEKRLACLYASITIVKED